MLYNLGALQMDTRPFNADDVDRRAGGDFAVQPFIGRLQGREAMGEGDDVITISGQLLPFKTGGLDELEMAHEFRRSQTPLPLVRGDGKAFGWFVIDEVSESHSELMRDGVGFIVKHTIRLTKTEPRTGTDAGGVIAGLLSLFGVMGAVR